jgi:hypothetical protein
LFRTLIVSTALVVVVFMAIAYRRSRDPFHPMLYLGSMVFFMYVVMPWYLGTFRSLELQEFLRDEQLSYVQAINLIGVVGLLGGVLVGAGGARFVPDALPATLGGAIRRRLYMAALGLGGIGWAGYLYTLVQVGGFAAAYGERYGGGWDDSGYVRESFLLTIPALILIMTSRYGTRLRAIDWLAVVSFALPLLAQGLLGARRGPTFMILMALGIAWYGTRGSRPGLATVLAAGAGLAFFLLLLVANRDTIHLGSELRLDAPATGYLEASEGNEFVYGSATIVNVDARHSYFWGKRFLVIFLFRPIPRAIWPNKYDDSARLLSIPNLDEGNLGLGMEVFADTVGWVGAQGSAPGIIADLWAEFWIGGFLILALLGYLYGRVWRQLMTGRAAWLSFYALMVCLSLYLIAQSFEAWGFRMLLLSVPTWLAWRFANPARVIAGVAHSTPQLARRQSNRALPRVSPQYPPPSRPAAPG